MPLPPFLRFTPAPLRTRHDGWNAALQRRFILTLARGASISEAARSIGKSRQTAYALRDKPGAEGFAAAWDAAFDFARQARAAAAPAPMMSEGFEAMLVPRFYRGRLVGFVQRPDHKAVLRTLAQLDKIAGRVGSTGLDPVLCYEALDAFTRSKTDKADEISL
jgi:hypothetical protein